jgi:hypothetical protein
MRHHTLPDLWERTPSYAPTPGYPDREWTPSVICPSPDPGNLVGECSPFLHQHTSGQLSFDPVVQLAGGNAWDELSSDRIHYQIEWRVKLNNRVVVKDSKQDLTQPPRSFWEQIKEEASNILRRKIARGRRVRLDDTNMVLSMNSQRDIDKHFQGTNVDWTAVEKQLLACAHLARRGKNIRLQISINYIGIASGAAQSAKNVSRLEYGRDSIPGQMDSRKLVPVARTACQVIVSSSCLRTRQRFPRAVSTRGRKNRSSPIVSPDIRSNPTNRNSIQCTSVGKRNSDI